MLTLPVLLLSLSQGASPAFGPDAVQPYRYQPFIPVHLTGDSRLCEPAHDEALSKKLGTSVRESDALWKGMCEVLTELGAGKDLAPLAPRMRFPFGLDGDEVKDAAELQGKRFTFPDAKDAYIRWDDGVRLSLCADTAAQTACLGFQHRDEGGWAWTHASLGDSVSFEFREVQKGGRIVEELQVATSRPVRLCHAKARQKLVDALTQKGAPDVAGLFQVACRVGFGAKPKEADVVGSPRQLARRRFFDEETWFTLIPGRPTDTSPEWRMSFLTMTDSVDKSMGFVRSAETPRWRCDGLSFHSNAD